MADRNLNYSMLPQNFNPSLMQHQQQLQQHQQQQQAQQQQQQTQQDQNTQVPGFTNPEHGRMWQQMQQQMQNPYQQQQRGNGDNVVTQQMANLIRSQNIARQQRQQIGQQQPQQQQQFNFDPSQSGSPGQPQPFHDSQPNQPPVPPMPNNFAQMSPAELQAMFNNRGAMLQAFQANQGHSRQIELMNLAQNQQPQNGNFARMAQQQGMNGQQGFNPAQPTDMFSSPAMAPAHDGMHNSPSHAPLQPPGQMGNQHMNVPQNGGGMPAQARRSYNINDMQARMTALRDVVRRLEQEGAQVQLQRAALGDAYMPKMQQIVQELKVKKEMLHKMAIAMNQFMANAGNAGNMNAMGVPSQTQQGAQGVQGTPGWPAQQGPSQQFGNPQVRQNTPLPNHGQLAPQNLQPSPSPMHTQAGPLSQQNIAPARSGPTPHQLLAGQNQHSASPSMGNQLPFSLPDGASNMQSQQPTRPNMPSLPPPLDKAAFDRAYIPFCTNRRIHHDQRVMQVDNRPIDLHALHANVMKEGGREQVTRNERWPVIAAKIGFVQFPATDTEPAKSGPGIAAQIAHVYKEYLLTFDSVYIRSVWEKSVKVQQAQAQAAANGGSSVNGGPGPNGAPSNLLASSDGGPRPFGNMTPAQLQTMVFYSGMSAAELRSRGVGDKLVQWVEQNRVNLQRTANEPNFRNAIARQRLAAQQQQAQQSADQHGLPSGNAPFNNPSMPGQNAGMPGGQFPPGARPQLMPQQGGPSNVPNGNNMNFPNRPQSTNMPIPGGAGPSNRPVGFGEETMLHAVDFVAKVKKEFLNRMPGMNSQHIPDEQVLEYKEAVENLFHYAQEIDSKLAMYFVMLKNEENLKKLIAIVLTAQHQRSLLSSGTPKYIVDLRMVRAMIGQIQNVNDNFNKMVQLVRQGGPASVHQPPPPGGNGMPPQNRPQPPMPQPPPQGSSQPPQQQQQQSGASSAHSRQPSSSTQQPAKRKSQPSLQPGPSHSSPTALATSPAAASTPAANASTPAQAASSPQTPKSPPKGKAPKPKAAPKRRNTVSKAAPPPPPAAAPTTENTQSHPSPNGTSQKRRREDEPAAEGPARTETPPKKIKTEWEGPPSEAMVQKRQELDNIKTEEEASAFLLRMIESAGMDGQDSADLSNTLDLLLKGIGGSVEGEDGSDASTMGPLTLPDTVNLESSSTAMQESEFFDFSSYCNDDEDNGSKAPTPDLVPSSSTNPSPESASEADAATHAAAAAAAAIAAASFGEESLKTEESLDTSDPLRLGLWKEIDGGESAYYQPDNWKWDGPMPTSEQPWAIS